ncbi:MAG: membrane protein insertase YidC [Bacteroidaceae bacterium]|nr:membrane protein insertase YidC [Bacteroidaceae bacterium]
MDKNTVTGFILMAAVLVLFSWYSRPSEAQLKAQRERDSIAAAQLIEEQKQAEAKQKARDDSAATSVPLDSASALFAASQGSEQLITLENDLVRITINTHGGMIEEAELKNYKDQQKENVRLLTKKDASMTLSLAGKQENIVTSDLYFQVVDKKQANPKPTSDSKTLSLNEKQGETLTLSLPLADGSLDIDYTLRPDAYMVDMIVRANGIANLFAPSMRTLDIQWNDRARQLEKGFDFEQRYACIRYHRADGKTKNLSETSDKETDVEEALDWVAFKNQFFSAVLISQQQLTNAHLKSQVYKKGQGYLKNYEATMQTAFDPTGTQPTQLQLYVGPNDFHALKAHNKLSLDASKDLELEDLVYLGWPIVRWVNRWFIIYLFDWLKGFGLHMGLVLLLLTIIVKALVYPATKKSYLASARMRVLKPKMDEINKKYPKQEDAMKKQQEMMQLYSQYGVSPMGGCLPMLIQMPIWIALFNFVPNAIELRGQSFLWADDLSAYDDVIRWGKDVWLIGDHLSIFCVLFCVMQIANTWISMKQQQNAMMSPEQEQSMKMMKWMMYLMPIMFFFMFNTYSSGLNYYYFLSGLTSILIMWFLRRTTDDDKLLAQMEAYKAKNANNPKKASGMAARLEALQRMAEEQQRLQQKK